MEYEYDLTEALEVLGLPPVEIHWEMLPEYSENSYGLADYERPNEIWINLSMCLDDGRDVAEVIAHELVHLWQYRQLDVTDLIMFKLAYTYDSDPMELHAEENAPKIAQLIKRIK